MNGYVYVMFNPAFPHLIKVGRTTRSTNERAEELYSTGTPGKFIVAYDVLVDDCVEVEAIAHRELERYRYSQNREFFECGLNDAIKCVDRISQDRRISEPIEEGVEESAEFFIYGAFLGDGDQWMKWTSPRIKNKVYRFGLIGINNKNEEDEWSLVKDSMITSLPQYYSKLGFDILDSKGIKLIDIISVGFAPNSLRSSVENIISEWSASFCSDGPRAGDFYEIIYDSQTISFKAGQNHDYAKQLVMHVASIVYAYLDDYRAEIKKKKVALEKAMMEKIAASFKGNF